MRVLPWPRRGGGEEGPDLTRSTLVAEDKNGDKIGPVVRNGRPEHGMPRFNVSTEELASLVAFIHDQKTLAESQIGQRRGVEVADLQTGNVEKGRAYFNGAGKCTRAIRRRAIWRASPNGSRD